MKSLRIFVLFIGVFIFLFYNKAHSGTIPSWVKEGLVVVYYSEGGAGTGIGTTRGSGAYGSGYRIFVVLSSVGNEIYGLDITLLSSPVSGVFFTSNIEKLGDPIKGGLFFVDPKNTDKIVAKKEAPPKCKISGNPGTFILECKDRFSVRKTMFVYDRKTGLVKEFTVMEVTQDFKGKNSSVMKGKYMKHFYIDLPKVKKFPPEALNSRTYRMINNMLGMPFGNIHISFTGVKNGITHYNISMTGVPVVTKAIGLPLLGPHYINPVLLKRNILLNIPEANFQVSLGGTGYKGGTVLQYIWNGSIILQQEYDPQTGLKLYEFHPQYMGGFPVSIELIH